MKYFQEYIKTISEFGLVDPDRKFKNVDDVGTVFSLDQCKALVEETHVFVFTKSEQTQVVDVESSPEKIDLPFKKCFFEILGAPVNTSTPTGEDNDFLNAGEDLPIWGVFVEEKAPKFYEITLLIDPIAVKEQYGKTNSSLKLAQKIGKHAISSKVQNYYENIIEKLCQRIGSENCGQIATSRPVKAVYRGSEVPVTRQKNFIIVSPDKKSSQVIGMRNVDWSHRWSVRGHWRNILGRIGKDRDGEPVADFTWVSDYVKGPEHLEYVKKARIVKDHRLVQD